MMIFFKKSLGIFVLSGVLPACGTYSTITNNNEEIRRDLLRKQTNCKSISRIYSGVTYDFCTIHSSPRSTYRNNIDDFYLALYGVDIIASSIADTLMLPITIGQQNESGSVDLEQ